MIRREEYKDDIIIIHNRYRCIEVFCSSCGKSLIKQTSEVRRKKKEKTPFVCKSCTLSERNKANALTHCRDCGVLLSSENEVRHGKYKTRVARCKSCYSIRLKEKYRNAKIQVIEHYGGKCSCCGESTYEFLTVDHVNNDGKEHRTSDPFSKGNNLYKTLIRKNFEVGYELQLLCWNCNEAKNYYGICPHQKNKKD